MSNGEGVLLPEPALWIAEGLRGLESGQPSHVVGLSREEANEEVTRKSGPGWALWSTDPYYTEAQLRAYGEQCRAQGWIPVGERLPDEDEHVLAYWDGVQECALGYYDSVAGWISVEHGERFDNSPTHWMPLPATPTPGGSDERG